mmetsp:Transcript_25598/g.60026  ORF Transcript_25598/g.60026 Transcript_25598/m.60026 type:complete len:250 (-) Transcript_25598:123-872(-)
MWPAYAGFPRAAGPADPVGGQAPALGPFHGHEGRKRAPRKAFPLDDLGRILVPPPMNRLHRAPGRCHRPRRRRSGPCPLQPRPASHPSPWQWWEPPARRPSQGLFWVTCRIQGQGLARRPFPAVAPTPLSPPSLQAALADPSSAPEPSRPSPQRALPRPHRGPKPSPASAVPAGAPASRRGHRQLGPAPPSPLPALLLPPLWTSGPLDAPAPRRRHRRLSSGHPRMPTPPSRRAVGPWTGPPGPLEHGG